jgi:hypothetical protein
VTIITRSVQLVDWCIHYFRCWSRLKVN